VPIIQSSTGPDQHDSSPGAPAPILALPHIATSSWRPGDVARLAALHARLSLSADGRCPVAGDNQLGDNTLLVWPAGYHVVPRDGHVTVLDETGAEAARVGDLIKAGGGAGEVPANACGLSSAFQIESEVRIVRGP